MNQLLLLKKPQAERDGYSLIVVGSRNQNGVQRALLGSVSDRVAHHASCNVLIVKS